MKKLIISTLLLIAALIPAIAAEKYAVLVQGCEVGGPAPQVGAWNNGIKNDKYDEFWNDTYLMWERLMLQGYKNENIFVLYVNGTDYPLLPEGLNIHSRYTPANIVNYPGMPDNITSITDYPATKTNLTNVLTSLQSTCTKDDFLFVWTFGHGYTNDDGKAVLSMHNSSITDTELANLTTPIKANKKVYWMQQCHSGGFIPEVTADVNSDVVITTAAGVEIAHRADNIPVRENEIREDNKEYNHGEFNFHMYSAIAGETPVEGVTSYNGVPLSNADTNNDGIVSVDEAKEWNLLKESQLETPQHTDNSTIGRETTLQYPTIFFQDPTTPYFQNKVMKGISAFTKNSNIYGNSSIGNSPQVTIEDGGDCTVLPSTIVNIGANYPACGFMLVKKAQLNLRTGAEIIISHGSTLSLADATVNGGKITVKAGGYLNLSASTKLYGTTIDVEDAATLYIWDSPSIVDIPMIAEGSVLNIKQNGFVQIFGDAALEVRGIMNVAPWATLQGMNNSTGKIAVTGKLNINGTADGKVNITGFSQGIVGYKDLAEIKINHANFSSMNTAVSGTGKELSLTNSTMSNCANGVNLVSFSKYNVSSSTFTGNNSGIGISVNLSGDRGGYISGNTLQSWNKGLAVISCAPTVANNTITNNVEHGIYVAGSNSIPDLMSYDFTSPLNNTIHNNGLNGSRRKAQIFLDVNARITLDNGYNNIYSNLNSGLPVATCVYNNNSGFSRTVYARNNYWGSATVTSSFFVPSTGNWLTYSPFSTVPYTNNKSSGELTEAQKTILSADQDEEAGLFAKAEAKYRTVVEKYPDTQEGYTASSRLLGNFVKAGRDLSALKTLYTAKSADDAWQDKKYFAKMIIKTDMNMENYDLSIAGSEVMKTAADSLNEKMICDLDIAVATMLKNGSNKAADYNCARDLQNISNLTDKLLGNATGSNSEQLKPVSTNLLANYPNPFNPTTTINYTLTAQAEVKVAVYNGSRFLDSLFT